ncbi:hypothetical protein LV457_03620 [Mycobacterium sp. MYCO198283]|uniref:hypothetical protein n=1 Tax=Mycobacterium sp. MYCO198283 TaxID=2883505 RepID=UPI001E4E2886|nr:hypothetical protein [Mycobacterium sp. MYCO198283]MCG5431378.1 hypothetical protein [Mycobacterium sp. MYCO198283]
MTVPEPIADDADTGPVHVVPPSPPVAAAPAWGPPPPAPPPAWSTYFDAAAVPQPRRIRRGRGRIVVIGAAVVLTLAGVAAGAYWLTRPDDDPPATSAPASQPGGSTTESDRPAADPAGQALLREFLPTGYPPDSCTPADAPAGADARLVCGPNTDPGGPVSSSYTLATDPAALAAALGDHMAGITVVGCPRNMQSPGPWRRNATPEKASGTLVCGFRGDRPTLAWTDDTQRVLATTESTPAGPNLDQLYTWWATHA